MKKPFGVEEWDGHTILKSAELRRPLTKEEEKRIGDELRKKVLRDVEFVDDAKKPKCKRTIILRKKYALRNIGKRGLSPLSTADLISSCSRHQKGKNQAFSVKAGSVGITAKLDKEKFS